ncbi:manganese transport protein [Escherichia coli]|uniref:Manganese transport protein n=1 Tax=Escherichia coli TaxID=562 RepID=A0A376J5Q2_ECOLX|nr:manganese transport protein [Escherichia coli]
MTNYRVESSSGRAARKMRLALMGPAFIAAIGYIDPGNFATNIQAGASFGYQLLWVVVWANLMAMLIQILSAKLGIATGKNLAEQIRDHYPRPVVWFYWVQAEIIAMATDLAEFIGAAIGFKLILGVSLLQGAVLTGIATFLILMLQRRGQKPLEKVIGGLLLFVAAAYIVELIFSQPNLAQLGKGMVIPSLPYFGGGLPGSRRVGGDDYAACDLFALFAHSAFTWRFASTTLFRHQMGCGYRHDYCRFCQSGDDGYSCGGVPLFWSYWCCRS